MKYRKGDVVSLIGTVKYDAEEGEDLFVKLDAYYTEISADAGFATLVSQSFKVGDLVQDTGGVFGMTTPNDIFPVVEIVAIYEKRAWVKSADAMLTVALSRLSRAEVVHVSE